MFKAFKIIIGLIIFCSLFSGLAMAKEKYPSKADGYRETAMFNGNQNMPFTLYGIAIDWHLDCLKGKGDKCMRVGEAMEAGEGDLVAEIRAALGYYLAACEKGEGVGCTKAAMIMRAGSANFISTELAQKTATRGCDELGNQDSCVVKAIGLSANGDPMAGVNTSTLIESAYSKGSDYGCQIKATNLFRTEGDEGALESAIAMFEKACREGHAWGCTGLAEAYSDGIGVRADRTQALSAARSGCLESEGNTVPACSRYGYLLIRNGPQRNMSLGIKLLVKACLASDAFACNEVGEVGWKRPLGTGITAWEVPLYFRDGCDLNNADACFNLASIYEIGFDQLAEHQSPMLSLLEKACSLGSAEACDKIKSMGRAVELMRKRPPKVDPSKTALQQLAIAVEFAEQKKYAIALDAVVRLMHEGVPEASWVLGGWFYYGYPGMINEPRISDGIILIENAARLRHVEAAKWISMAYWYGDNVAEDREKGQQYMAFAAQSGDPEARDIYRSMLAEPIRQERARREREMAEEAERRKHDWGYQISLARAGWLQAQQGSSYGTGNSAAASASWQRSQSALDKLNWNNAVGYATGRTTACPISNPYC